MILGWMILALGCFTFATVVFDFADCAMQYPKKAANQRERRESDL
jgi:hypothetical protein